MSDETEQPLLPWFAGKEVPVLTHRINRRLREQQSLFATELPPFVDHLAECLLFGQSVVTGRRYQRHWKLGNRNIDAEGRYLAGRIGYASEGDEIEDTYDDQAAEWRTEVVSAERHAAAPFAIAADTC